jgi:6,7-dimethyl-8-ribityllumazine synthase
MQQAQQAAHQPFDASSWRLGIVVAQFNKHITGKLYDSAVARAAEYSIPVANIDTITVAGSVEVPLALQHLAQTGKYDALLAIGCVIKGDTPHFDYVCQFATEGILRVQLDEKIPIGFGILTCNDEAQAVARTDLGGEHLDAALQLVQSLRAQ